MYNRQKVYEYAKKWAYKRNPKYYNFDSIGGDCTNFVSQCVYSGCKVMNFTKTYGWYYINSTNRAPAWTGTEYLYKFLINNKVEGPFAVVSDYAKIKVGDIVQFGYKDKNFSHSVIVVNVENAQIFVAAHSIDSYMRPIESYDFDNIRFLHIVAARKRI